MIDFVQGTIFAIEEEAIIVNVNGIGYHINVPRPDYYKSLLNENCFIYTHHHFREDWMGLFGFKDKEERQLFRLLLSVSGIGPKGALAIISQADPHQVINAIAIEDEKALCKMPGIGKKTAQRIILDLKDKVKTLKLSYSLAGTGTLLETPRTAKADDSDLYEALKSLGYHEQEIVKAMNALSDLIDTEPLDLLIKKALTILIKG